MIGVSCCNNSMYWRQQITIGLQRQVQLYSCLLK
jgi:hypothetical protein